jgi:hypothetical protein
MRKALHVCTRDAKQMHAFVKLIGGMRAARSQLPELRPAHTEVAGDPFQLAPVHRVQLAAAAPPFPQPRQVRNRLRRFRHLGREHGILRSCTKRSMALSAETGIDRDQVLARSNRAT